MKIEIGRYYRVIDLVYIDENNTTILITAYDVKTNGYTYRNIDTKLISSFGEDSDFANHLVPNKEHVIINILKEIDSL